MKSELPCEENARRAAFVIADVAEDIDGSVGGDPIVAIIKDSEEPVENPVKFL